jgi:hyperosmotically inducible protein
MNMRLIALSCAFTAVACGGAENRPAQDPAPTRTTAAVPDPTPIVDTPAPPPMTWSRPAPPESTTPPPASQPAAVFTNPGGADQTKDADNTRTNERDRHGTLTPLDQGNSAAEIKITASIRRNIVANKTLSFDAKNVKVITIGNKVTLRGPVKSDRERSEIEALVKQTVGVQEVDDQLEVKP